MPLMNWPAFAIATGVMPRWSADFTATPICMPRQRVANSILRTGPCLPGLYSLVTLIFVEHAHRHALRPRCTSWYAKTEPTFSDAIATVRRPFWSETILQTPSQHDAFEKLPRRLRQILLDRLSLAA